MGKKGKGGSEATGNFIKHGVFLFDWEGDVFP